MIVIDTHVWLWWISNPEKLFLKAAHTIDKAINESDIIISSITLPGDFHPDPADRIITATAMTMGLPLITKDDKILDYPHIKTIWE